jgi:hypothetical protein
VSEVSERVGLSTAVVEVNDLPAEVDDRCWVAASEVLFPGRLRRTRGTGAWALTAVLACRAGVVVGVLPLRRARTGVVGEIFDPVLVAPAVFGAVRRDPRDYLHLGGPADLVSGCAVAGDLSEAQRDEVRRALVAGGHAAAAERGLVPAVLYVRDAELDAFRLGGVRACHEVAKVSVLPLPATDEEFLAGLSSSQRRTVRKDREAIAGLGLRVEVVPAAELIASDRGAAVVELIMDVKRQHGVTDHPRLARLRLAEWAGQPGGERVAYLVGDPDPVAVTFGCVAGSRLEIYETGMSYAAEHRHEAYLESLFHAPIRHALAAGLDEIDMGLDAETPKTRRGAVTAPVWAVG